jgi:hypothetical protein
MGKPSIHGCDLKLGRAENHLAFLDNEWSLFLAEEDRHVVRHFEPETRDYVFRLEGEPPPEEWGVILGEVAHNCRSALDLLLWQLILKRGGTPKERVTQFPIYNDPADFEREAKRRTEGVSTEDSAFIKDSQPGYDPNRRRPLTILAHINNVDKHRFLTPVVASIALEQGGRRFMPGGHLGMMLKGLSLDVFGGGQLLLWDDGSPVFVADETPAWIAEGLIAFIMGQHDTENRTEILRLHLEGQRPDPEMHMDPRTPLDAGFSDGVRKFSLDDLRSCIGDVRRIVDHFRPVFEVS